MLRENATLDEAIAHFRDDKFAYEVTGCRLVEVSQGHAVAELELDRSRHYNAAGGVMGGATFTLADFAFAAASNYNEKPSVGVSNSIEYLAPVKGTKLIAVCDVDRSGRSLGFYTVLVSDDTGRAVAKMTAICHR